MPATRSSSQQRTRPRENEPYPSSPRALPSRSETMSSFLQSYAGTAQVTTCSRENEPYLSSSSFLQGYAGKAQVTFRPNIIGSSPRSKRNLSKKPLTGEVLEISSSSDEGSILPKAPGNGSESSSWQRENSKLKHTNEKLEQQLADQRTQLDASRKLLKDQSEELAARLQEIDDGRKEIELQQEKLDTLQAKLEEVLSCHICAHLMYSPYILIDCGHCYCEGCLKGWFDETLTKHIREHPAYNMDRDHMPRNFPQLLQTLGPYVSRPIQTQLQDMYNTSRQQQPVYTCPGCRKEVTGKPVINYVVKDMVSDVGNVLGQPDTRREPSNIGPGQRAGPFDGFFPHN
ncbi:hypothetical protein DEU56DRAFT_526858 [Suillus clintonianus]|uniref:uncharacterized protein n=1 Tax=Suillus clintonianus TaxID=1904413 RepID=UPI001B85EA0D|nr:uncharacterized protein DEU56DRAFT_526858 [Suillus clintonianus]KAG2127682.1 hypothetical protein DEU56DRAFT_526858 [Suillus clintonianus]